MVSIHFRKHAPSRVKPPSQPSPAIARKDVLSGLIVGHRRRMRDHQSGGNPEACVQTWTRPPGVSAGGSSLLLSAKAEVDRRDQRKEAR